MGGELGKSWDVLRCIFGNDVERVGFEGLEGFGYGGHQ